MNQGFHHRVAAHIMAGALLLAAVFAGGCALWPGAGQNVVPEKSYDDEMRETIARLEPADGTMEHFGWPLGDPYARIRAAGDIEVEMNGVKARLLGIKSAPDAATRAVAKKEVESWLAERYKDYEKDIAKLGPGRPMSQEDFDYLLGPYVRVGNRYQTIKDADGVPLVWIDGLNTDLVEKRLALVDYSRIPSFYRFADPRGGWCYVKWRRALWEKQDPRSRPASPPVDMAIPTLGPCALTAKLRERWSKDRVREYGSARIAATEDAMDYSYDGPRFFPDGRDAMIVTSWMAWGADSGCDVYDPEETGGFRVHWEAGMRVGDRERTIFVEAIYVSDGRMGKFFQMEHIPESELIGKPDAAKR